MASFYRFKNLSEETGCLHAVTQKDPMEPYAFSLALHTGEASREIVANRKKVISELGLAKEMHFVVAEQTHSDHIAVIGEKETKGWEGIEDAVADCDALITDVPGVMLMILTADCVPVLLYEPEKKVAAAVHAGWKGTYTEIAAKTVRMMADRFGCDPRMIRAGIGPAIGKCCYEVGEDVARHFFEIPEACLDGKQGKYRLDLPYINKYQLLESSLLPSNIEMSHLCTACETASFFSYRKEQGCSGRFMSMIGLC
ncbi:peptidoglycan editing factor PgeF [Sulfurovum sp.]|uniref:peptidoglycan editing factor PgeF n=1 Tax=Sulfurovum sp. TaxID=1969726 RepID=UPI00260E1834|nr:peptidoglycan editing factor PgeF [Sulfurovum sp.]